MVWDEAACREAPFDGTSLFDATSALSNKRLGDVKKPIAERVSPTIDAAVPAELRFTIPEIRPNKLKRTAIGTKTRPRVKMPKIPKQLPRIPAISPSLRCLRGEALVLFPSKGGLS